MKSAKTRQTRQLPQCAFQCLGIILPQPSANTSSWCNDASAQGVADLCLAMHCTVRETLTSRGWYSQVCGTPVRDVAGQLRVINWTLLGLALLAVIFRFASRMWIFEGDLGWDDWSIFAVATIAVGMAAVMELNTRSGLGKDIWDVEFDTVTHLLFYIYIGGFLYLLVTSGAKISILCLYIRIFDSEASERHRFRNTCRALITLITATSLGCIVSWFIECQPLDLIWTRWTYSPSEPYQGHCINTEIQVYTFAALNMVYDLVVFCLPIRRVLKMQNQSLRRKITTILTFLVGLFVTACSAVRLQYLVNYGTSKDPTYQYAYMAMVSMFECYFGIICACMPLIAGSVRRMFRRKIHVLLKSRSSHRSNGLLVVPPVTNVFPRRTMAINTVSNGEGYPDHYCGDAKWQESGIPAL